MIEIWECDFDQELQLNEEMKNFVKQECNEIISIKPLNPRDAFYGGRTCNNVKLFDCQPGEYIRYYDFCSLYLYINKRGVYCLGHLKIYVGQTECASIVGQ